MKLIQVLEGYDQKPIKIPALKPRDPNQAVLANKKNAGGRMRNKKKELEAGKVKHKTDMVEASLGPRVPYESYKAWKADLPAKSTFHKDGNIERAQALGKDFEGVAGTWYADKNSGWIYAYYLDKKNLLEGKKPLKVKEPGWYVVDHMDTPIEGPMQEGAARRLAAEMTDEIHSKGGKGDIPAYDVLYFTDYEIRRAQEKAYESVQIQEKWNDSGASDAKGRWSKYANGEIGVEAMATWLYNSRVHKNTKAEKLKSAYGAIAQQENTSKLISGKQADALRAALKKKYSVNESEEPGEKMVEYVYRVTFSSGYSTGWKTTHLPFDDTLEMAKSFDHPYENDQGWVTKLVEPILGVPHSPYSFYPIDYEPISASDDMLKLSIEYHIHHKDYDPTLVHVATLTIQAV